ncbi:MAG: short-chain fatty acid transporter [Myxococcales bacterium]|nr:short-chain fatty acid transporter [Myxococcales bacterium]
MRRLGHALSGFSARWVPDPFAIALALTLITFALAWGLTDHGPAALLGQWGGRLVGGELTGAELGFWRLLAFGMQMCLILVTGFALASTRAARAAIRWLADRPQTPGQAITLTALVAMAAAYVNWGLGLIVGALLARDVARSARRRGVHVHYPLLGAAGYTGLMVWHGGLSGTAPFKVTQAKDIAELLPGVGVGAIPLDQTVLGPLNLCIVALTLVLVPLVLTRLHPRAEDVRPIADGEGGDDEAPPPSDGEGPAAALEGSRLLAWVLGGAALIYLWMYLSRLGFDRADVNAINLLFLALGLILHGSPRAYAHAIGQAASGCAGIILQFPFYAGIMGLMQLSGLITLFAEGFASIANPTTFGPLTFLSAGLVNLFVPSGGGQWGVQGAVVMQTASDLGVDLGKAVMAFAYGDGWTNMLQPFWALPLLAITGLKARELVGYTAALMLLTGPIYLVCLAAF